MQSQLRWWGWPSHPGWSRLTKGRIVKVVDVVVNVVDVVVKVVDVVVKVVDV